MKGNLKIRREFLSFIKIRMEDDAVIEKIMYVEQTLKMNPTSSLLINNKAGSGVTDPSDSTTMYFDTDRNRMTYSSSVTGGKTEIMTGIFDAVVAADGGDYTSVAAAFAGGAKSVYVRTGTYIEVADVLIPSGGRLIGESISKSVIYLATGNSVKIEDTTRETTAGTITVVNGSATISGTGTDFQTAGIQPGDYILLGTKYYPIATIVDDLSLTIDDPYRGSSMTNVAYRAHKMNVAAQVQNVVIYGSTGAGLYLNRAYHPIIEDVLISTNTPNIMINNCGSITVKSICSQNAHSDGCYINNTHTINISGSEFKNNMGEGMSINGDASNIIIESSGITNNGGNGLTISGTSDFVTITDIFILHNNGHGIYTSGTSESCAVSDCNISHNGSDGIHYTGIDNCATNCIVRFNGGNGINSGDDVVITGCIVKGNTGHGVNAMGYRSILSSNNIRSNGGDGIRVTNNNQIVSGNQVSGNTGTGILLVVGTTMNKIHFNNSTDNGTDITDSGTGNMLSNN